MHDILQSIKQSAAQLKLSRILENKYETGEAINAAISSAIDASKKRATLQTEDPIEILKAYRTALGEELWDSIRNNSSLPVLMKEWEGGERAKNANILLEEIRRILPEDHDLTQEEIVLGMGIGG